MSVSESLEFPTTKDIEQRVAEFADATRDGVAELADRLPEPVADFLEPVLPRKRGLIAKLGLGELGEEFEALAKVVVDRLPAPLAELTPLRVPAGAKEPAGSWNLVAITSALLGAGPMHFLAPKPFDRIVPPSLPGSPRLWTYLSGLAEIGIGALIVIPRTRRLGGLAAASLFTAVYPANVQMAKDFTGKGAVVETIAYGRLPLQFPLIWGALKIAIKGK